LCWISHHRTSEAKVRSGARGKCKETDSLDFEESCMSKYLVWSQTGIRASWRGLMVAMEPMIYQRVLILEFARRVLLSLLCNSASLAVRLLMLRAGSRLTP
jgi:hypothetical protein